MTTIWFQTTCWPQRVPDCNYNDFIPAACMVAFEFVNGDLRMCDPCLRSGAPYAHFLFGSPAIISIATIRCGVLANHAVPTSAPQIQVCDSSPLCAGSSFFDIAAGSQSQSWTRCICCLGRLADTDLNHEGSPKHQAKAEDKTLRARATAGEQLAPNKAGCPSAQQRCHTKLFYKSRCRLRASRSNECYQCGGKMRGSGAGTLLR